MMLTTTSSPQIVHTELVIDRTTRTAHIQRTVLYLTPGRIIPNATSATTGNSNVEIDDTSVDIIHEFTLPETTVPGSNDDHDSALIEQAVATARTAGYDPDGTPRWPDQSYGPHLDISIEHHGLLTGDQLANFGAEQLLAAASIGALHNYEGSLADGPPYTIPPMGRWFIDPDDRVSVDVLTDSTSDEFENHEIATMPGLHAKLATTHNPT